MKGIAKLLAAFVAIWSLGAVAAETPPVREFYACNLQNGKTMADVMAIRDVIVQHRDKAGNADLTNMVSLLWTPVKTNGELDFLWFDMHANANAMARAQRAFDGVGGQAAVDALASKTAQCAAGIVTHEAIYQGTEQPGGDGETVLVESFRCELRPGKTVDDARKAVDYWKGVIGGLSGYGDYLAYMQTPLVSQSSADLYYFAVHADLGQYAARLSAYSTSKGGIEADRRFNEVHRCQSSLWTGQVVIGSLQ